MGKLKDFLVSLWTSDLQDKFEFEKLYKIVALNTLFFIGFIFFTGFGIYAFAQGNSILGIIDIGAAFIFISIAIFLRKTGNYKLALPMGILILSFAFLFLFITELKSPSGTSLWLYSFPLMIFFLLGNRKGLFVIPPFFLLLIIGIFFTPMKISVHPFHYRFLGSFALVCVIAYCIELFRSQFQARVELQNDQMQRYIEKQKNSEAMIKQSEFRYRTIFENSGTAIITFGDDRIVRMCNNKFCELISLSIESIIGNVKWSDFIVEEDIKRMESYHQLRSQGLDAPTEYEFQLKDMDGKLKDVLMNISINPETKERTASMIDLTEQKLMQKIQTVLYHISEAVNSSKNFEEFMEKIQLELSAVINTKNFYIALYDKEKDELTLPYHRDEKDKFNSFPVGKSLTGYVIRTKESLLADRDEVDRLTNLGLVESIGARSEVWLGVPLIVQGEIIGVLAVQDYESKKTYHDEHRKILEFVSGQIALAIERRRAEEEIKREKIYLQKLFESSPEAIVLATNESIVLKINPAFTKIFGYREEEVIQKNIDDLITTPELNKEAINYTKSVSHGDVINIETKRKRKNGDLIDVSIIGTPIMGDEGQMAVYGIYRDITQRKISEEKIARQQEYLKLINKILRHDLMNNLSVVNSALRLFERTKKDEFLLSASQNVKKGVELITKMRDLEAFSTSSRDLKPYKLEDLMLKYQRVFRDLEIEISGSATVLANDAINSLFDNLIAKSQRL
jgi:PAS domain S-box-containing protein